MGKTDMRGGRSCAPRQTVGELRPPTRRTAPLTPPGSTVSDTVVPAAEAARARLIEPRIALLHRQIEKGTKNTDRLRAELAVLLAEHRRVFPQAWPAVRPTVALRESDLLDHTQRIRERGDEPK